MKNVENTKSQVTEPQINKELGPLRQEIQKITESIIELAKKREHVAGKVAEVKDANHIQVENPGIERGLRIKVKEHAKRIGLEETHAEKILDLLLDFSKKAQRKQIFQKRITSFLEDEGIESVFIVGSGRMGGWFANYFRELGREVSLFDSRNGYARRRAKELDCKYANIREANDSNLVLLAVPISETRRELIRLEKILKQGKKRSAIIEVSSIKGGLADLQKQLALPFISIHPLFGPSAPNFGSNSIIVIENREESHNDFGYNLIQNIFPQFDIFRLDAKTHDEQMSLVLSLPHSLALAFRAVIGENSKKSPLKVSTPSYAAMNEFATRVLGENPDVYFEIQSMNKFTLKVLEQLIASLREQLSYVREGKRSQFRRAFLANAP